MTIEQMAASMRACGVLEATVTNHEGTISLKLGPVSSSGPPVPATTHDELLCKCGHSLATDHTDAGCLHGCAVAFCLNEADKVE